MTRTIHVRGCIGCPFHRQGLDDSDDPEFTDDAGRGAADYCSAASLMQAPPRPPFVKITGGADVDLRPAWCPLDGGPVGVEAVARFDVAPSLDALARLPCTCGLMRGVCGGFHVTESAACAFCEDGAVDYMSGTGAPSRHWCDCARGRQRAQADQIERYGHVLAGTPEPCSCATCRRKRAEPAEAPALGPNENGDNTP